MSHNIGTADRTLRLVLGAILILVALFGGFSAFDGAVMRYCAIVVGVVLMGTAAFRFCPLYTLLGIRTCRL